MDIFELAYKITGQGQTEAAEGLQAVDAAGAKAAQSLTGVEAAAARATAAAQRLQQAGIQIDQGAFNKGLAQGIAQGFKDLEASATASAAGLGTFNQTVNATVGHAAGATRGLYLLDRGFGAIIGSALGATSGFERLGEGLLLFATGGHEATLVLAAIAVPLIAGVSIWHLLSDATRQATDDTERARKTFEDGAGAADLLATAVRAIAAETERLADAQARLAAANVFAPPSGTDLAAQLGGAAVLAGFGGLAAGTSQISGPLTAFIAQKYEQGVATDAATAKIKAENAAFAESLKVFEDYAAGIREQIALHGATIESQRQLAAAEAGIASLLATHTATLDQLNKAQKTQQDDAKAVADALKLPTEQLASYARGLASAITLGTASAAQQREALQIAQGLTAASQDQTKSLDERNTLAAAAKSITDAFSAATKEATKAIHDQVEALIKQADLAEKNVAVMGLTDQTAAGLKTALAALEQGISAENVARLINNGLIDDALKLLAKEVELRGKVGEKLGVPGGAAAGATFGLGGVATGATGAPITFGQGISLAPAEQAALIPERPLTGGLGTGLQAPLIPANFFDQSLQNLQQGFDRVNATTRMGVRVLNASLTAAATDLAKSFQQALASAFVELSTAMGRLIAGIFTGIHPDFGKEILAALGGIFTKMGEALIAASKIFEGLSKFLSNPLTAGPAMAIAGAALVVLGATLGAIATGSGGAGSGGGASSASNEPVRVVVVDSSVAAASRVAQIQPFVYAPTNYGITDPQGQRSIAQMQQLAQRRNISGINRIG